MVASFADFASFDEPVDFANFAEFESADGAESGGSVEAEKSVDGKANDIDFAPSEL